MSGISIEQAYGDGFDPEGCASCGGTLLFEVDRARGRAWLRCSGCLARARLGPWASPAVRAAIGDQGFEIAPIGAER